MFGLAAARDWLRALDLFPAYFGYGTIISPSVNAYSMLGAVVGWGTLSPIAKYNGWAPGPLRSWDNGSRGWIVWVGMALILGDSIVGLVWITSRSTLSYIWRSNIWPTSGRPPRPSPQEQSSLLSDSPIAAPEAETQISHHNIDDRWPEASITTTSLILKTSVFLLLLYFGVMFLVLNRSIHTDAIPLVVALVPFAGFISVR